MKIPVKLPPFQVEPPPIEVEIAVPGLSDFEARLTELTNRVAAIEQAALEAAAAEAQRTNPWLAYKNTRRGVS